MSDYRQFWIGFNLVKGIGAVRFRFLLDAFGDAEKAWHASPDELRFLEAWGIVWIDKPFPMIDNEKYFDYDIFISEVKDKWGKQPPYEPPEKPEYITCQ